MDKSFTRVSWVLWDGAFCGRWDGLSVIEDDIVYGEMLVRYDTTKDEREALVSVIIFPQSVLPKEKQIYIHSLTLFDSSVSE